MKNIIYITFIMLIAILGGCQFQQAQNQSRYETVAADPTRDTDHAKEMNQKAISLMDGDNLKDAESHLRQALAADVMFGPAHNNLGHVYFKQKKYYLAAWEFQYAAKLMPNQAEPKNNLAMVLEIAGKPDQATEYYEQALKIQPDNPEIIANLARLYVKQNQFTQRTRELLNEIILKDQRPAWTQWAKTQLAMGKFKEQEK